MIVQFHVEAGPPRRLICLCGDPVILPDCSPSVTCRCGAVYDVTGRRVSPPARFRQEAYPSPVDGRIRCAAPFEIADDFGDNVATMRCQRRLGHVGPHMETWANPGDPTALLLWWPPGVDVAAGLPPGGTPRESSATLTIDKISPS